MQDNLSTYEKTGLRGSTASGHKGVLLTITGGFALVSAAHRLTNLRRIWYIVQRLHFLRAEYGSQIDPMPDAAP
jgi:hypothetical protein